MCREAIETERVSRKAGRTKYPWLIYYYFLGWIKRSSGEEARARE
jgi:hypothetical protein